MLSAQDAANVLCVSATTVHRWMADGTLPVEHVRDRPVIRSEDVQRLQRSKIWLTPFADQIWA